jgi:Putative amidoligase enzyme
METISRWIKKKEKVNESPVPFSKSDQVRSGLRRKHNSDFEAFTFGVEFEFLPELYDSTVHKQEIINKISDSIRSGNGDVAREFYHDYPDYPKEKLDALIATYAEYTYLYGVYNRHREELGIPPNFDFKKTFTDAANFIKNELHEPVEMNLSRDTYLKSSKANWQIERDGPNVEVRTRHMQQTDKDFASIEKFGNWVARTQRTNKNSGMHVHVGLPQDVDAFDLLAIVDVVDEKSIVDLAGIKRDAKFNEFAKLKRETISELIRLLFKEAAAKYKNKIQTNTNNNGKLSSIKFELSYKDVEMAIYAIDDRNMGINLKAATQHKTIEFRYAGTDTADKIVPLVKYYCLIPKIAQTRNKIVLTDDKTRATLVAIRKPEIIEFVYGNLDYRDLKASVLNLPAADIKREKQKKDRERDLRNRTIEI